MESADTLWHKGFGGSDVTVINVLCFHSVTLLSVLGLILCTLSLCHPFTIVKIYIDLNRGGLLTNELQAG